MSNQVLLTSFLIALSCNLDNVGVGISYGTRGIRVPWSTNLFIALLTATGTCLAMLLGQQTFLFISPSSGAILGGAILIVLGVWVIVQETLLRDRPVQILRPPVTRKDQTQQSFWQHLLSILENPSFADQDHSGHIDIKEGTLLGLALMLNNLPNGVAAAMIKLPLPLITLAVGLLSMVTFWVGLAVGRAIGSFRIGPWTWVASGLLLIGVGLAEVILTLPIRG